ncbi:MAG: CTP-dependent riboflavin kinase [Thaumarchaeota archaeon]|nr:CTP-dependent riboflavin kinase [Nitrososphaerota archaeon]
MTDLKVQHILTLTSLLSKGAKHKFVSITTSTLGESINKSQQAASKHLLELETDGFIERMMSGRNLSVKITPNGYLELVKLYTNLRTSLDSLPSYIELKGTLVSGMGEGAYYMSLKGYTKQFKKKIGYIPFPGTLNISLSKSEYIEAVRQFDALDGVMINGFSDGKRTYGWVKCFRAKLNKSVDCHLIRLERTLHDKTIIELISKPHIRKTARLSDGSKVTVRVNLNSK